MSPNLNPAVEIHHTLKAIYRNHAFLVSSINEKPDSATYLVLSNHIHKGRMHNQQNRPEMKNQPRQEEEVISR